MPGSKPNWGTVAHQKVCPRLKKKLKWPAWPTCGFESYDGRRGFALGDFSE
jgi:hypothetical protein